MRRLIVFESTSLDGYFTDVRGDMSFAHRPIRDAEWDAFVEDNARGEGTLLFGRVTYELMVRYWPTPLAAEQMPVVARRMNAARKVVFSRTLREASWGNTTVVKDDVPAAVRRMKQESDEDLVILGSGSLVAQLAPHGLVDEYQIVVIPVALGKGRTLFEGVTRPVPLALSFTRNFPNGNVLLCYEPAPGGR